MYSYKGMTLRANKEEPTIPAALAGKIVYIEGLDDTMALRTPFHISPGDSWHERSRLRGCGNPRCAEIDGTGDSTARRRRQSDRPFATRISAPAASWPSSAPPRMCTARPFPG